MKTQVYKKIGNKGLSDEQETQKILTKIRMKHKYRCGGEEMTLQVEPTHYFNQEYDNKNRFISYWHQINEIFKLPHETVLEIGIGNGFVSKYLRERGVNIVTLDIDKRLKPDIVGSVLDIPFQANSFQIVACYELLEHLPYRDTAKALSEISRVSKQYIILSLPDVNIVYRIYIHIPKIGEIKKLIPLPRIKKPIHRFDGEHYWEIGKAGYPLKRIIGDMQKHGLKLERTYRVYEMPYHRFFILRKEN